MINLRYHIVSIVAVFLALGVGVALGATFIDRATVDFLNNRLDAVEDEVRDTNARNEELEDQLARLQDSVQVFSEQSIDRLYDGRLSDVPVLLVGARGVSENAVADLQRALVESGAQVGGTVWFNDRISLRDDGDRESLAQILGVPGAVDRVVRNLLVARLTETLDAPVPPPAEGEGPLPDPTDPAAGEPPTTTTTTPAEGVPAEPDGVDDDQIQVPLLVQLRAAGFIEFEPPAAADIDLTTVPLPGSRYVFVGGVGGEHANQLFVDVLERITRSGAAAPAVAVEVPDDDAPREVDRVFVGPIRDDEELAAAVSTVDNLQARRMFGVTASIYALVDVGDGRVGHYGTGPGAQRLVPAAPS